MAMKEGKMMCSECGGNKALAEDILHFFSEVHLSADATESTIEVLRVGVIRDRGLRITRKMLEDYVQNFKDNVYGTEIQVNLEHNRGSAAAGWVKDLYIEGDKLMATVEWTELGQDNIKKKLYKFVSAELAGGFPHHQTGKTYNNVFIGLALTNTPALKAQEALSLSEIIEKTNNQKAMLKKFLTSLSSRKIVSKEDKTLLHEMLEEATAEEQAEVKAEVAAVDAKPEEAEKPVEEKKEEEKKEEKPAGDEALSEKLVEQGKELAALKEKLALKETQEFAETFMLSEKQATGFNPKDKEAVVGFLTALSEEQRTAFTALMGLVKHVDASVRGKETTPEEQSKEVKLTEANKLAEQRAKDKGITLDVALAEVYKELKLV